MARFNLGSNCLAPFEAQFFSTFVCYVDRKCVPDNTVTDFKDLLQNSTQTNVFSAHSQSHAAGVSAAVHVRNSYAAVPVLSVWRRSVSRGYTNMTYCCNCILDTDGDVNDIFILGWQSRATLRVDIVP